MRIGYLEINPKWRLYYKIYEVAIRTEVWHPILTFRKVVI